MASPLSQLEVDFTEAANNWNLEKLYIDLADAKGKSLTPVEKKILRGLLCGYSPAEIADKVYQSRNSNVVRVYLSNGLYKYIEELLIRKTGNLIKVKTWSRVIQLLEKAGYKTGSIKPFQSGKYLPEQTQKATKLVSSINKYQDWGEAVDVSVFYGRTEEIATLERWIVKDRCRLVALLGMGGIGKTAISVRLAEQIQDKFDYLIWRSLLHAPSVQETLASLIQFLSNEQERDLPETVAGRTSLLIDYLRSSRCLLVLDNAEAILEYGDQAKRECALPYGAGHYREGYEGYSELLRRVGETLHQSCLVLTSREKPRELVTLEGDTLPVRSLQLGGLKPVEGRLILQTKGCNSCSEDEWIKLTEYYAGNPQVLKIVATTIQALFGGNISKFLKQGPVVFGDICDLLDQHFNRLSELEKKVMYWLTINHSSVSLPLRGDIVYPVSQSDLLEALESLGRRCLIDKATPTLIEKNSASFTQNPMLMEYVTKRLIHQVFQ